MGARYRRIARTGITQLPSLNVGSLYMPQLAGVHPPEGFVMPFNPAANQTKFLLVVSTGLILLALLLAYNRQLDDAQETGAQQAANQCVADNNAALLAATQQQLAHVHQQLTAANQAVKQLQHQQQITAARNKALQGEIDHVTQTWLPPGKQVAEPQPACVFTRGFVRVYNQSIQNDSSTANMPAAARAGNVDGTPDTAAVATDLQESGIGRADILQHINQYGQRCQDIEAQLTALQEYLLSQGTN